jgi:ABC-type bacteriocin/lantibiotic exporter with double-glycine peptidase domain
MPKRTVVLAVLLSAGCAYRGSATDFDPKELQRGEGWLTAAEVPVILQKDREGCGAAVLAMALAAWRRPATQDEILQACPPIPGKGIQAGALRDFARRTGLQAFVLEGEISDLEHELSKARPLIVGLVKPTGDRGLTHFELVVALHRERGVIVTIDPSRGWRQNSFEGFRSEWEPAGRLLLAIFPSPSLKIPASD